MKTLLQTRIILTAFMYALFVAFISCETDLDPDHPKGGNTQGGNNNGSITPDELSELLVLKDDAKITGSLPVAPDGQLKINEKDTIYLAQGFPVGERVVVRHDGRYDISGVYVGVENSPYYYDVPVIEAEEQDSTDVIYINWGDADGLDWTFPLILQPHGPDGTPLDEFNKVVKIEIPGEDAESITVPTSFSLDLVHWEWMYSALIDPADPDGNVLQFEGKGVKKKSAYQTGGCCDDEGKSTTVANDPYCFAKYSDGTPNPYWRTIDVSHFFMWAYDILYLYDDGTFRQSNTSVQTNYRASLSDFCNNVAVYDFDINTFVKFGTHDFVPGATHIKFTYNTTDPPVFGKNIYGGELKYTSHSMLISFDGEVGKWYFYYKRPPNGVSRAIQLSAKGWD